MSRRLLQDHISPLVNRLRSGEHQAISLPDVAAVTEILMRSLESYFKSIDLTIYQECQSLADYIDDARLEIASLSPEHSDAAKIPRAGLELAAIVQQTESATNTIMESAERIMEADPSQGEAYTDTINDAVMQIFEACSFQDITGQRISKVVSTLEHVEDRVSRLINILGVMENSKRKKATPEEAVDEDKTLLHGPALEGEGIDQAEIDALISKSMNDDRDIEINDQEAEVATGSSEETGTVETPAPKAAPQTGEPAAEAAEAAPAPTVSEYSNSSDIDLMFDGPSEATEKNSPGMAAATPQAAPNLIEQAKQREAAAKAERKARIKPQKPVVYEEGPNAGLRPKTSEKTTQSDIDALFS